MVFCQCLARHLRLSVSGSAPQAVSVWRGTSGCQCLAQHLRPTVASFCCLFRWTSLCRCSTRAVNKPVGAGFRLLLLLIFGQFVLVVFCNVNFPHGRVPSGNRQVSRTGIVSAQFFCASCNAFRFHHTWTVFVQHIIANILKY